MSSRCVLKISYQMVLCVHCNMLLWQQSVWCFPLFDTCHVVYSASPPLHNKSLFFIIYLYNKCISTYRYLSRQHQVLLFCTLHKSFYVNMPTCLIWNKNYNSKNNNELIFLIHLSIFQFGNQCLWKAHLTSFTVTSLPCFTLSSRGQK